MGFRSAPCIEILHPSARSAGVCGGGYGGLWAGRLLRAGTASCSLCWTATSTLSPSSAMFSASLRAGAASSARLQCRSLATAAPPSSSAASSEPLTHFRITLRRSAISLPSNIKGTLAALGIHRRLQTVYHRHTSDIAGKILTVKELLAPLAREEVKLVRCLGLNYADHAVCLYNVSPYRICALITTTT